MKKLFFLVLLVFSLTTDAANDKQQILSILKQQQTAWNEGDLVKFMAGYWQSDELAFVGKSGIKKGWITTLKNYQKSYPDKKAMGKLNFTILDIQQKDDFAFVLGKWELQREKDTPNGHFTLLWKKIDGHWKIIIDHSS